MNFILRKYQEKAVKDLLSNSRDFIEENFDESKILFHSPTGSGKTVVVANFLERFIAESNPANDFVFIWIAPRKLHNQSNEKLSKIYKDKNILKCSEIGDLKNNRIQKNEILFLNWESINKSTNTFIKENEDEINLESVIKNTKQIGSKVILIIDEYHHGAATDRSLTLVDEVIKPNLSIQMTATPKGGDRDAIVRVRHSQVVEEGMIKKNIIPNEGFKERKLIGGQLETNIKGGTDILFLEKSLKKRKEIHEAFIKKGIDVNPLLLVQLPDDKKGQKNDLREKIEDYLNDEYDISVSNGKLGIYLSKDKKELQNIKDNNNEVEVLIFKQAIALGWDCPRAHVIIFFREWKESTFSKQTIGRVLRMPEPEKGHYDDDLLDNAFIFANQKSIKVEEDISKGYVSIQQSNREHNPNFSIHSVYTKRQREKTRLDKDYVTSFLKAAETSGLKNVVKLKGNKVTTSFLSENKIESLDRFSFERDINATSIDIKNTEEMESYFNNFSASSLAPEFYPEDRSIKQVNKAIYIFFLNEFQINFEQDQFQIMEIVLSKKNIKHFRNTIEDAKALYQEIQEEKDNILEVVSDWNIPKKIDYQNDVTELSVNKSIMMPFFYNEIKLSNPERYFINYLDESKDVVWWYKNGEKESKYFAVSYKGESITKPFFVDFIIMLKNKKIGFFDTKSGTYLNEAMTDGKNEGLLDFLKSDSNYFGGIVTNTKDDGSGVWKVFKKPSQKFIRGDLKNWENLNF